MRTKNLVVFDRFFDSTYAYQKITSKDKLLILNLINQIEKKYIPTITFYFKINKKTLLERKKIRGEQNFFDKKYASHFTYTKNYDEIGKMKVGKRKFITIDASKPKKSYIKNC